MSHISKKSNSLKEKIRRKIPDTSRKIILDVNKESKFLVFYYKDKISLKITRRELGEFISIKKHSSNATTFLEFLSYLKEGNWKENKFLNKTKKNNKKSLSSFIILTTEIKELNSNFIIEFNCQDIYEDSKKIVFEFRILNLQNNDISWVTNKELDSLLDDYVTLNNGRGLSKIDESTFVIAQRIIVQSYTDMFYRKVLLFFFRKYFHSKESKNFFSESTFMKIITINNNDLIYVVKMMNSKYDEKDIYKIWKNKLFKYVKLFEYETKMNFDKYYLYCSEIINNDITETILYTTLREKIDLIRNGVFLKNPRENYPFNINNLRERNIINKSYNDLYLYRESVLKDINDEIFYSEIFKINEEDEIKFIGVKIDKKGHADLYKYDYFHFKKITESFYKKMVELKVDDNVKNIIITPLSYQILWSLNFYNLKKKNINFFIKDIEVNDDRTIKFIKTSKVIQEITFIVSDYFEKTFELIEKIKPSRIIVYSDFLEKTSIEYSYEKLFYKINKYVEENESVKLIEIK